jgi:hypothetical protein
VKNGARIIRALLLSGWIAASAAHADELAGPQAGAPARPGKALSPVAPPVTPQVDGTGMHSLRLRLQYFDTVTGNVELRRHQYFVDDNLKSRRPRTTMAWTVRWYF